MAGAQAHGPSSAVADLDALLGLGNDLSDAGDEPGAEAYFRAAAEQGSADGWFNLGNSLLRGGRPADALPAYLQAEAAGVDGAPLNAGLPHEELKDWPAAEAAYRRAIAADDPRGRLFLGDLWRWHGDETAAEALWRQAANDGDALSAGALARWLLLRGLGDDAESLLRQAMDADDDARSDLAWLLRKRGETDSAEALLRQGADKGHPDSMIKLALLLEEDRGDTAGSEAVLRAAIAAGELHAHNNLGTLLRDRGELIQAQQVFRAGALGGDGLAARNLAGLRAARRRQLNRAYRKLAHQSRQAPAD